MIVRRIYYGTIQIIRVYLGGRIVWMRAQHVYARGSALGTLETDAGPYTAVAELTAGSADGTALGRASARVELVAPVLMICAGGGEGRAGGNTTATAPTRGWASGRGDGYASTVTYGIVYSAGAACGRTDIRGSPRTAEVVPTAGAANGTLTGRVDAETQEPERVRMSAGGTMTGSAGAVATRAQRTAGQATGGMTAKQAGAAVSFGNSGDIVLLTAEEDGTVYLMVDGVDHPLENVSDPEASGDDNTYIIEII